MKFLVDMNLSPNWVSFVADAGFTAVHWSEVGRGDASDIELMQWAAKRDHIVLTADLDFGAILAATQRRQPGVIQIRADVVTPPAAGSCRWLRSGKRSRNSRRARSYRSRRRERDCGC